MRKKWTEQQKRKILADWHESESTRADFCKKVGISVSGLDSWRRKFESPKKSKLKIKFVEIPSLEEVQSPTTKKILRIISSYGAVIEVPL